MAIKYGLKGLSFVTRRWSLQTSVTQSHWRIIYRTMIRSPLLISIPASWRAYYVIKVHKTVVSWPLLTAQRLAAMTKLKRLNWRKNSLVSKAWTWQENAVRRRRLNGQQAAGICQTPYSTAIYRAAMIAVRAAFLNSLAPMLTQNTTLSPTILVAKPISCVCS